MNADMLEQVQAIDSAFLTGLVRQDQNNPDFEIGDWTVQPISHEKIIDTTGGLYRFSGQGRQGAETKSWSLVLKILKKPQFDCIESDEWCYWKREMLAFGSGLLAGLPPGVKAPRGYAVTEHEDSAWLWMEHMVEATDRVWSLDHYRQAAQQAGRSSAAYLNGHPLPDYPWFTRFFRSIYAVGTYAPKVMDPQAEGTIWDDALVQQHFTEPLRSQILSIWQERDRFHDIRDRLPQVLCHNDFHRRNLMFCAGADGQQELIALDWAFMGHGALGSDLGELIGTSMCFNEVELSQAENLEIAVMEGYIAGLHEVGWQGDPRLPRLGYLLSSSLWMGVQLPFWTWWMQQEQVNETALYGYPADQLVLKWVELSRFLMTRADEARYLIDTLGLG